MNNPALEPHFSAEHMARKIYYLKEQMDKLHQGTIINRRGLEYVKIYKSSNSPAFERRVNTPEGMLLAKEIAEYRRLKIEYEELISQYNRYYPNVDLERPSIIQRALPVPNSMTMEYYNSPPDIIDPYPPQTPYIFEGIVMKSRFEIIAAQTIRELNLEFKYGIPIITPQSNFFIDMIIPVPERGRCVGFEFCGKVDDFKYMNTNCTKKLAYLEIGLIPNHDVIFVYGGQNWIPPTREIKNAIIFGIEKLITICSPKCSWKSSCKSKSVSIQASEAICSPKCSWNSSCKSKSVSIQASEAVCSPKCSWNSSCKSKSVSRIKIKRGVPGHLS